MYFSSIHFKNNYLKLIEFILYYNYILLIIKYFRLDVKKMLLDGIIAILAMAAGYRVLMFQLKC